MTKQSLSSDIWRACDLMRSDDGTTGMMEYMEQLSWILFLKAFEAVEDQHEAEARFARRAYQRVLDGDHRWSAWTGPAGMPRLTGPALSEFVDNTLFPHLRALSGSPERDIIATIFQEIPGNRMKSGYLLREVIDIIDEVDFHAAEDVDTISHIYETLLGKLGGEGGIAGEFYTPRHIIRLMVEIVDPKIGETVYDPAAGSAGFLVESYARLKAKAQTSADWETLQRRTFFGREKKPLPYLLGVMNMILHGVQTPRIARGNTLAIDVRHIAEKDRYHVVLTNPPFGGKEHSTVQQNFPVPVAATELLFLQHIMKSLKVGGRCGVVVPEGVLFRGDAFAQVKKDLLENFNLHTIVSLPAGVFANVTASGSGPKTNLLFFDRPGPTKDIWYYEVLHDGFTLTKARRPILENDLPDCLAKWPKRAVSERSWLVPVEEVVARGYDLTAKNPNRKEDLEHRPPEDLVADVLAKEQRFFELLDEVEAALNGMETTTTFDSVRMGTFLKYRKEFFIIDDGTEYRRVTVQLHARGVIHRDRVTGSKIKTKKQQRIKAGQLLVAEIDAKVGGFGVVPEDLDGAIVSSHYFLYDIDTSIIHPKYLEFYLKSGRPEDDIQQFVKGSLNYASIRPEHYLQLEIPLPPIAEQQRIAERIETVEALRRLHEEAGREIAAMSGAVLAKAFRGEL